MQPPTLTELYDAQVDDHVCIQTALTIRSPKALLTTDTEDTLVQLSPIEDELQ